MKGEVTSKKVASLAGALLYELRGLDSSRVVQVLVFNSTDYQLTRPIGTVGELRSLAASCLTQSPDKPKRKSAAKTKKENQW